MGVSSDINKPDKTEEREITATSSLYRATRSGTGGPVKSGVRDDTMRVGSVLRSRYVLEGVVGRGGSSTVFRATDLHRVMPLEIDGGFIALKLLQPALRDDPQALLRLRREFRQTQRLTHAGIVRAFDLDCDENDWFMTMELLPGRTARDWMELPHEPSGAIRIIGDCCDALEHAHSLGVVHGDLKPTNLVVSDDGAAKLIDFGSATSSGGRLELTSDLLPAATALYASPQVLAGHSAEPRDDIFSLACLSYGLLSGGRHPFGRRPSLEDGRAKVAPTYLRDIPPAVFEVIERGLSVERERRHDSARAFNRDLTEAFARATNPEQGGNFARINAHELRLPALLPASATVPANTGIDRVYRRVVPFVTAAMVVTVLLGALAMTRPGASHRLLQAAEPAAVRATEAHASTDTSVAPDPTSSPGDAADRDAANLDQPARESAPRVVAARPAGTVSFDTAAMHVSARQPLVAVAVKRLRTTRGSGAFGWRVENGSARAGIDFQRVGPAVVRFIDGQTVRTLFVPLISAQGPSIAQTARSFTVELEPIAGGAELGPIRRVTITIDPPTLPVATSAYQARAIDIMSRADPDEKK
jgi:hypothetical protein